MLQLDPSNPINSVLIAIIIVVLGIWIVGEIKSEGGRKGTVRVVCGLILSVLFMILMTTSGMIVF